MRLIFKYKKVLIIIFLFIFICCNNVNNDKNIKLENKKTIKIASFNVLRLGEKEKDYNALSKVISNYDLIGLQEVMNEKGLKKLKSHLEKQTKENWGYIISDRPVGSDNYREYYAFLYKKDVFSEVVPLGFYEEENKNEFMREPFACKFKAKEFDFVFVLVHSIFGDGEQQRIIEASNYINVYKYFLEKTKEEDIIIGGDFNLSADNMAFKNMKQKYNVDYLLEPSQNPTTLSNTKLVNSYDNFFLNKNLTREYNGNAGVHNAIQNNNYKEIRKYISDHMLIYSEYNIEEDLDNE